MKKIVLSVLAVLFSAIGFKAQADSPIGLRAMSFNIRTGGCEDGTNSWKYRAPSVGVMLMDKKPDIFGLQEAEEYQVTYLKEGLEDYGCVGVGRDNGRHEGEHMEIFYNRKRLSLQKWGTFWLSETPDTPSKGWDAACFRTATWAVMKDKKNGTRFIFVNTHIDHIGALAQQNGISLIVEKVKELNKADLPVIIAGDFNLQPDSPYLSPIREFASDARETAVKTDDESSFNGWGRSSGKCDFIWYRGFDTCTKFETVTKPYLERNFVSDHFPVEATLFFK